LEPYAGLVIRYSYLWKREHEAGREDGTKDRPCAVVMAIVDQDGEWDVLVLPITHSPPPDPADAIEIPTETKKRLGLDTDRSWVVITEANEFLWPGPDLLFCRLHGGPVRRRRTNIASIRAVATSSMPQPTT
jgi:hypothetical protein